MIGDPADHIVIGLRQPDLRLRQVLLEGNTPFLLALDDPCAAAADIIADVAVEPHTAVRAVASHLPAGTGAARRPAIRAVRPPQG